ncbi:hypothetical protein ACFWZT_01540 [Streptomyces alboflavus]|uniref:hypothetical protein n=1 Tax=Streptomyces alboflavus TaxID=67267 RepID=UPI0036B7C89D
MRRGPVGADPRTDPDADPRTDPCADPSASRAAAYEPQRAPGRELGAYSPQLVVRA